MTLPFTGFYHSMYRISCPFTIAYFVQKPHASVSNKSSFYSEGLLAPRPKPKIDDHPLSVVRCCLFNIFVATHHTVGRSSIRNLRARHAVVTDQLIMECRRQYVYCFICAPSLAFCGGVHSKGRRRYFHINNVDFCPGLLLVS